MSDQRVEAKGGSTIQNVIQAVVNLSPWAWVVGVVILAIAAVLAAGIFNVGPLQKLLPTPMPLEPASEGQSLIIVADFEDRSDGKYQGVDPAQYIYEKLVQQARADDLDVRIERLREGGAGTTLWGLPRAWSALELLRRYPVVPHVKNPRCN
jgi:hypothetical protein